MKAQRVEELSEGRRCRAMGLDGLTVAAHQEKAVEEEGTQITLNNLC